MLPEYQHLKPSIGNDLVDALLATTAKKSPTNMAVYRSAGEQEKRLEECYKKWSFAFSVAAISVCHDLSIGQERVEPKLV